MVVLVLHCHGQGTEPRPTERSPENAECFSTSELDDKLRPAWAHWWWAHLCALI
jgi:hypothetical protein